MSGRHIWSCTVPSLKRKAMRKKNQNNTKISNYLSCLMSMPNSPISFHGNAVPDGVITGSRKRKQTFSMNDPDNVELARLATQAAKKKAKLSKVNSSEKGIVTTNQKNLARKTVTVNHLLNLKKRSTSRSCGRESHGTPGTLSSQVMTMTRLPQRPMTRLPQGP